MNKRTVFLAGLFFGVLSAFIVFRGPDLYNRFSPNGYQTFAIAIPNSFLENNVVPSQSIATLVQTFNETLVFAMARAIETKNSENLKKLDMLLAWFAQYDEEQYKKWRKTHPKHF